MTVPATWLTTVSNKQVELYHVTFFDLRCDLIVCPLATADNYGRDGRLWSVRFAELAHIVTTKTIRLSDVNQAELWTPFRDGGGASSTTHSCTSMEGSLTPKLKLFPIDNWSSFKQISTSLANKSLQKRYYGYNDQFLLSVFDSIRHSMTAALSLYPLASNLQP